MASKFETIGANRLSLCDSLDELNKTFAHSCELCCTKGRASDCRYCEISYTHNLCAAIMADKNKECVEK